MARGADQRATCPFTEAAIKAGWPPAEAVGGKLDDTTVLVSVVEDEVEE